MFSSMKFTVLTFCFFLFVSTAFAQKATDFEGTWKVDYEATKALIPSEDKAGYTEEVEKMLKPMMSDMQYNFLKGGKFELYLKTDKISQDGATWVIKGRVLELNLGKMVRNIEIKEASKTKIVFYDKNEKGGFKTTVLVPAK